MQMGLLDNFKQFFKNLTVTFWWNAEIVIEEKIKTVTAEIYCEEIDYI